MTCEVHNKEINSQCAELLVRPLYIQGRFRCYNDIFTSNKICMRYNMTFELSYCITIMNVYILMCIYAYVWYKYEYIIYIMYFAYLIDVFWILYNIFYYFYLKFGTRVLLKSETFVLL